jgi:hypothetical protein
MILEHIFNDILNSINNKYKEIHEKENIIRYSFSWKIGKFEKEIITNENKKTSIFRTLRIYGHNYNTNERFIVEDIHYVAKNSSVFLTDAYKANLFRDFIAVGIAGHLDYRVNEKTKYESR